MSKFERILAPDSLELPECRCGADMPLVDKERPANSADAELRVYRCSACQHELRLTVWKPAA
jgi:predicted SprT family Zn-dependent metalloprotease